MKFIINTVIGSDWNGLDLLKVIVGPDESNSDGYHYQDNEQPHGYYY